MRFSDRADWWPTIDAAQCSGTPARSHRVTNHLRLEWNTTPGQLTPALTRSLANCLVTMLTLSPGNSLPLAGNRASIAVSPECNGKNRSAASVFNCRTLLGRLRPSSGAFAPRLMVLPI